MIKRYCDICQALMTKDNTPHFGRNCSRLSAVVEKNGTKLEVEVITTVDGVSNAGDVCTHCVLDALYKLDNRPRLAP